MNWRYGFFILNPFLKWTSLRWKMAVVVNVFFLLCLTLCLCVAAHVWSGWRRRQRLEATHCLQKRLLSQPSCYPVVLEGMQRLWAIHTQTPEYMPQKHGKTATCCQTLVMTTEYFEWTLVPVVFPSIQPALGLLALLLKIKVCLEEQACLLWWKSLK